MNKRFFALIAACVLAACASKPPPVAPPPPPLEAALVLTTLADVNPDSSGRPSPVVVRIYQLKTDSAFVSAGFSNLFDHAQQTLGADLITADEYQLIPGERRTLDLSPAAGLRYVGAAAAFHDIRNSNWRAVLSAPPGGWGDTRIEVTADATRIRIQLGH